MTPALRGCLRPDALEAVLYLGGAVVDARAQGVNSEMLWSVQWFNEVAASDVAAVCGALGAMPAFWSMLLVHVHKADNTVGMQQWAAEQATRQWTVPRLEASISRAATQLMGLMLRHGPPAAHPPRVMMAPLLVALCDSLTRSPNDDGAAQAIAALVATHPEVVSEALKFDLSTAKLRQLASLSSQPHVALALRALATPPDAAPLVAAVLPRVLHPAGVTPASSAELAALDAAREKRERVAHSANQTTTAAQDEAEVLAAARPLWAAVQAATTGRARVTLARANAMLRSCELRRRRSEYHLSMSRSAADVGHFIVHLSSPGTGNTEDEFSFTLGLNHIFGAPELLVIGDLPDMNTHLQSLLCTHVIRAAAARVIKAVAAGSEDERVVAARLLSRSYELPDKQCGIFASMTEEGFTAPGLCRSNNVVQLPELLCREVGDALTWRFLPMAEALAAYGGPTRGWCGECGASRGRATTVFYGDNAGLVRPQVWGVPVHVCSLAACFAALPKRMAAKVLQALRTAAQGASRERVWMPAPQAMAGLSPACAAMMAEQGAFGNAMRGVSSMKGAEAQTAMLRARMMSCKLEGCLVQDAVLKQCAACRKVAYCVHAFIAASCVH